MLTFLHLFNSHPHVKTHFKHFKDLSTETLQDNEIFQQHACRVMRVIDKVRAHVVSMCEYGCWTIFRFMPTTRVLDVVVVHGENKMHVRIVFWQWPFIKEKLRLCLTVHKGMSA